MKGEPQTNNCRRGGFNGDGLAITNRTTPDSMHVNLASDFASDPQRPFG